MQLTKEVLYEITPLAQKAWQDYQNNILGNWHHQLGVLIKNINDNGNSERAKVIQDINIPLNEIKRLLPTSIGFILNQWGRTHPSMDESIQKDANDLLNNWNKLLKISTIVSKLLKASVSNDLKRITNIVCDKLNSFDKLNITNFIILYNSSVGATIVLEEETFDKMSKLADGFDKLTSSS